ncbi:malonyl-ACP O-methyltransferase BioC [Geobacter sp. AOG1]|uniref:malonyl-ACP O-methyltransferase BioC n=1 Tax=Geobacter sp. AOG1 TaxID=1566346 RepID=UPI001CC530DB|nr:malonyl-ACP O-methyltransferase BioC [Geobacter sp. AOG1]GFE59047.1 malonyl-[acyl-carrier protein]O-methyltransferase [Geobacter sp. AOG1]
MVGIDRQRVRNSFHRHATEYEAYADVQKRVVSRLVGMLDGESLAPAGVLDIGTGTGMLLRALYGLYPTARLVGLDLALGMCRTARGGFNDSGRVGLLAGDAERLPFRDGAFDLVVSTSTYQWLEEPTAAFAEACRVLRPGGLFCFALFGEKTLYELRSSYRQAHEAVCHAEESRTHTFLSQERVYESLIRAGFVAPRTSSELETERHADVPALLRAIKRVGAGNAAPVKGRGLAERRVMLEMMAIYRREYAADGFIPATYEVIYGVGRKG